MSMRYCLIGVVAAVLLGSATGAMADVVRLKAGADKFGQGWRFLDQDGACKVVTAGHVVRGLDRKILPTSVLDGHGREWPAGRVLVNSEEPDIAVLAIPSANDPGLCGDGRLSTIGIARRVAEMSGAVIATTGESEVLNVPVMRRASVMDADGGRLFSVIPLLPSDQLGKGWSGSVVRDRTGPLGIVFEVSEDGGVAKAVRIDVVRDLLSEASAEAPAPPPANPARPAIAVLAGTTDGPAAGPDLIDAEMGWHVLPRRRTVVFTASFPSPTQLRQVRLAVGVGSANRIRELDVSTQDAAGANWIDGNYCRAPEDGAAVTCRFLVRTVTRLRLVVKLSTDDPVTLNGFAVE
jgi:hypothetical protein